MDFGWLIVAFAVGTLVGILGTSLVNLLVTQRKHQIDRQAEALTSQVDSLMRLVQEFEGKRREQHGSLDTTLQALTQTTTHLQSTLANERLRGAWGEQLAVRILEAAGFSDGTHYVMQKTFVGDKGDELKPDFTFRLTDERCVHMDAKFPWNNYERYFTADVVSEEERKRYRQKFSTDVKGRIDETRRYIGGNSLNCVLMFIPNETIFHFLSEDEAVRLHAQKHKVILCSPMSLLVVLTLLRETNELFALEKSLNTIRTALLKVIDEIRLYAGELGSVSKELDGMQRRIDDLRNKRTVKLEKAAQQLSNLIQLRMSDSETNAHEE